MKLTRRIVLILVVLSVAVLAFSAGKKAGKAKKKFPYLSPRLNRVVTVSKTTAEWEADKATFQSQKPIELSRIWFLLDMRTEVAKRELIVHMNIAQRPGVPKGAIPNRTRAARKARAYWYKHRGKLPRGPLTVRAYLKGKPWGVIDPNSDVVRGPKDPPRRNSRVY